MDNDYGLLATYEEREGGTYDYVVSWNEGTIMVPLLRWCGEEDGSYNMATYPDKSPWKRVLDKPGLWFRLMPEGTHDWEQMQALATNMSDE